MTQYGFHFDGKRCTGCKTCVLACKDNKDLSTEIAFRNVYEYGGGSWEQADGLWSNDAFTYYVSVACNHCDSPVCMAKCPQAAISKDPDTGIVTSDPEKCIGCGTCAITCPYSAPKVDDEKKKSVKCDMCADRVAEGKQPICVEACPLRALDFGDIDELRSKYGEVAAIAPLPSEEETHPNIVITEPVNAKPAGDTTGSVLNEREIA
ncbi:DMSO/selenate family reductase complex B subunit [Eggerthella sinensis]|uniref:DMSO/selenate family reductase complex B subunit n=1 Tax=Eggerthella sinensis TaxID=242230 RepID=UPI00266C13DE|nr:DMSO/selenate family reductase complex B subunit [Eggerthella sinensis]